MEFFNARRQNLSTRQATLTKNLNISSRYLQASFTISRRAAKCKTPHTVVEEIVIRSAL
jgi:hypothetical protein